MRLFLQLALCLLHFSSVTSHPLFQQRIHANAQCRFTRYPRLRRDMHRPGGSRPVTSKASISSSLSVRLALSNSHLQLDVVYVRNACGPHADAVQAKEGGERFPTCCQGERQSWTGSGGACMKISDHRAPLVDGCCKGAVFCRRRPQGQAWPRYHSGTGHEFGIQQGGQTTWSRLAQLCY